MTKPTYCHNSVEDADHILNEFLDLIVEGTWDWNSETGHVTRSPGWYRMLGYPLDIFQPDVYTWENLIHPNDYDRVMAHFEAYITGQSNHYCVEYRCRTADHDFIWIEDRGRALCKNSEGVVTRMIGSHIDIHRQKLAELQLIEQTTLLREGNLSLERKLAKKNRELEEKNHQLKEKLLQIEAISNTDALTGIANRKKFAEEIDKELSRAQRYHHPLSLIMLDVDHFKAINDEFGHKIGDEVLQMLAANIADNLRTIDCFARWGGEEFMIILPELNLQQAYDVAEKLRHLVATLHFPHQQPMSCSFGVVQYHRSETLDQLLLRLDTLLYSAKTDGRNCVRRELASA